MEFQHPMFVRNGARKLKEIKRGKQSGSKGDGCAWGRRQLGAHLTSAQKH